MFFNLNRNVVLLISLVGSIKPVGGLCPPGHHLKDRDGLSGTQRCEPCPKDTYMPDTTEAEICYPCNRCQETVGQIKIGECTRFHDTVCGCPDGQKWEEGIHGQGKCLPEKHQIYGRRCKKCPKGTHLLKPCTVNGGKPKCKRCGENTYMDRINRRRKCYKCTECPAGKVQVKGCSGKRDDAHCECPPGQFWHATGRSLKELNVHEKVGVNESSFNVTLETTQKYEPSVNVTQQITQENNFSLAPDPSGSQWKAVIVVVGIISVLLFVPLALGYCWKRICLRPDVYQEVSSL